MTSNSDKLKGSNSHLQSFEDDLDNLDIQSFEFDIEDFINNDASNHNINNDLDKNPLQKNLGLQNHDANSVYELNSLRKSNSRSSLLSYSSQKRTFNPVNDAKTGNFITRLLTIFIRRHNKDSKKNRLNLDNSSQSVENINNYDTNEREIRPLVTPVLEYKKYPSNCIMNNKYNAITFFPIILYEQFKFFFNLYFLLVALSQAIPQLRIGYLSSYIVPLVFVLSITMAKEAMDDIQRRRRDREQNSQLYTVVNTDSDLQTTCLKPSSDLKVGHIVKLNKNDRVPADMLMIQAEDPNGEVFIKTDQLDGETDWKLRTSNNLTQNENIQNIIKNTSIICEPPSKEIYKFQGKLIYKENSSVALSCDNTLWANTIIASQGHVYGIVMYTGLETRQQMNTTSPTVKCGLIESEINKISKLLCLSVFVLSLVLVLFKGFNNDEWYLDIMRYLILFSTIIPVSLRVNLDLGKSVYSYQIEKDQDIQGTIVRTSTIPEDLGRISYLLSDKTGTLTQNDMEMKMLHLGDELYSYESFEIIKSKLANLKDVKELETSNSALVTTILTLALCHNVTPTLEDGTDVFDAKAKNISYQAASPDEIAIVKFTEFVGLTLIKRDRQDITIYHKATNTKLTYKMLYTFPFNSDTKRMGIIVQNTLTKKITFLEKGADTVMSAIVCANEWLEEEVDNLARDGLRTLVIAKKDLTNEAYGLFDKEYKTSSLSMINRDSLLADTISKHLEKNLQLLALTGVEDKLQDDVKNSIETLRNAGIKIWMLTGDKVDTAKCVSISCRLISRGQQIFRIEKQVYTGNNENEILDRLDEIKSDKNGVLIIDGESLSTYLANYKYEFFKACIDLPALICCRCTPQQKADIAYMIRDFTGKRVCCIGDGGNDVSMIQAADVGIGIVGKEGKQASLAADFSITQFSYLTKLLLWHGRNSYKRSAKLSQFVIHRGLVISVCQALYSISSKFEPLALYQGFLMVGYSTCYTMMPVFALAFDFDIPYKLCKLYPELYQDLISGKSLNKKTFYGWCILSLYQGIAIQSLSQKFTSLKTQDFTKMVAISFISLVLNELIMSGLEIRTWQAFMTYAQVSTAVFFVISIPFLTEYFDISYVYSFEFFPELIFILALGIIPVFIIRSIYRKWNLPSYVKVQHFAV